MPRAVGDFAKAHLKVLRMAEAMQALAIMNIQNSFRMDEDEPTRDELLDELEALRERLDMLNAQNLAMSAQQLQQGTPNGPA